MMKPSNQLLTGDCVQIMESFDPDITDLTLTSPPYAFMRSYGGHVYNQELFQRVARQLARITKPGGTICWVVRNQQRRGTHCENLQAEDEKIFFVRECGLLAYQTIIGVPAGVPLPVKHHYANSFDYIFILSKGRPTFTHIIKDHRNACAGEWKQNRMIRNINGTMRDAIRQSHIVPEVSFRTNVWTYPAGGIHSGEKYTADHPARMPEKLCRDLILSYSQPGALVFDPFAGTGTTCKWALLTGRQWLGTEIHQPFVEIAKRRMRDAGRKLIDGLSV